FFGAIFAELPRPEVSSMRKVATCTSTGLRQRGHRGVLVLAAMPSRYDRATPQEGHGRNDAVAIPHLTVAASGSSDRLIGDIFTSCSRRNAAGWHAMWLTPADARLWVADLRCRRFGCRRDDLGRGGKGRCKRAGTSQVGARQPSFEAVIRAANTVPG